jgi:hypothetical protein
MDELAGRAGTSSVDLVSPATLRIVPTRKSLQKSSVSVSVELIERRIYLNFGFGNSDFGFEEQARTFFLTSCFS